MNDSHHTPESPKRLSGENLLKHLLAISHQMAGMRSVAPLLSYVVDEVMALVGAERGYIVLLKDNSSLDFKVRRRADGTDIQSDVDSISSSVLDEVIRTKESVVVRNALMDPQFGGAMSVMAMQLRSIMCSPLITQNRIIGAIYVENRTKSGRFSKEDVVTLEFFSNHAAVAIENAHLNENLETLVEKRMSELVEAKDAAEAAARAKSTFLSTMTHELRTPMNGVLGMTSLLADTPLNEEQREIIDTIRMSGDTLLTLINDILDFSKIEAQKVELEPVAFRLDSCIEQAIDLVTPVAADKKLLVFYTIDEDVPMNLVQDITRLRQIITNLLSNAVKFTEQGHVEIHVSLSDSTEAALHDGSNPKGTELAFAVSDSGIGISPERIPHLFQPFSQADSSTTRHYGGTGLGLVICKRLCELMGGSIEVSSEVGIGTTFMFSVVAQAISTPEATEDFSKLLTGKQILLVTSDGFIERSVRQSLRSAQVDFICQGALPTDTNRLDAISAVLIDATTSSITSFLSNGSQPSSMREKNHNLRRIHSEDGYEHQPTVSHRCDTLAQRVSAPHLPEWPFELTPAEINKPIILLVNWGDRFPPFKNEYPITTFSVPIKSAQLQSELAILTGNEVKTKPSEWHRPTFDVAMATAYPLRILVAEDNVVNQKVALRMLERYGYQADLVANGLEAVEAMRETAYDVVLMDIQMPKMDGIKATQIIRYEISQERQPYIIAMTANAASDAREMYLQAGMDDYISKPVPANDLQAALKVAAQRHANKIYLAAANS